MQPRNHCLELSESNYCGEGCFIDLFVATSSSLRSDSIRSRGATYLDRCFPKIECFNGVCVDGATQEHFLEKIRIK